MTRLFCLILLTALLTAPAADAARPRAERMAGPLFAEVTDVLSKNDIDIRALSIADTTNFGILRLIVDHPARAESRLKEQGFTVSQTDVIGVGITDQPGGLAVALVGGLLGAGAAKCVAQVVGQLRAQRPFDQRLLQRHGGGVDLVGRHRRSAAGQLLNEFK